MDASMNNDVTLSTYSYGLVFSYYLISIASVVALYLLKNFSNQRHSYLLFFVNTLTVVAIGFLQYSVFAYGRDFINTFYQTDLNDYNAIRFGGLSFVFIYLFLLPKNTYYKEMTTVENQHKNKKQG